MSKAVYIKDGRPYHDGINHYRKVGKESHTKSYGFDGSVFELVDPATKMLVILACILNNPYLILYMIANWAM